MKVLVWDSASEELEFFLELAQKHVDIDLFEELADLEAEVEEGDFVLLDLDVDRKAMEKAVKRIRKRVKNFKLAYLSAELSPKVLSKHQKSKVGADAYFRFPMGEKLFLNMAAPLLGFDPQERLRELTMPAGPESLAEPSGSLEAPSLGALRHFEEESDEDLGRTEPGDTKLKALLGKLDEETKEKEEAEENNGLASIESEDTAGIEATEPEATKFEATKSKESKSNEEEPEEINEEMNMGDDNKKLDLDLDLEPAEELSLSGNEVEDDLSLSDLSEEALQKEALGFDLDQNDAGDLSLDSFSEEPADELSLGGEESDEEADALSLGGEEDIPDLSLEGNEIGNEIDNELSASGEDCLDLSLDAAEDDEPFEEESEELDLSLSPEEPPEDSLEDSLNLGAPEDDAAESFDLDSGDYAPDLASGDDDLLLGGEEEAREELEQTSNETSGGIELGSMDEDDDLLFGDGDEPSFEFEEASQDIMSDEELFGGEEELSSQSLPESPELSASAPAASAPAASPNDSDDDGMSEDALRKLAEIEEMMKNDASGGAPTASDEISSPDMGGDFGRSQTMNLADQVGLEDEEPDFDPTLDMNEDTGIMENPLASFDETISETQSASVKGAPLYEPPMGGEYSSKTISEQRDVLARNDEEFIRLGETIKNLREDREALMETISRLEEKVEKEKRDFGSLEAELEEKKIELSLSHKRRAKQIEELSYRLELSEEKKMLLEEKNKRLEKENEALRMKVNVDVNRVKARERELESKLELLKSDTETQLQNRDMKILELKRKIDTLEFDLESLQMKEKKPVDSNFAMEERMERVINTLRRAIGELEEEETRSAAFEKIKKNLDV